MAHFFVITNALNGLLMHHHSHTMYTLPFRRVEY